MSIKRKLLIIFIGISLLVTITLSLIYYNISSNIAINTEINNKIYKLNSIYEKINASITEVQKTGIDYHINNDIYSILERYNSDRSGLTIEEELRLRMLLSDYKSIGNSLAAVSIYMPDDNIFFATKTIFNTTYQFGAYSEIMLRMTDNKNYQWDVIKNLNGELVLPYYRKLTEKNDKVGVLGVLELDLRENVISDFYTTLENSEEGRYFIINESGLIISSQEKSYLNLNFYDTFACSPDSMEETNGNIRTKAEDQNILITYKNDQDTGWRFINIVPINVVLQKIKYLRDNTILIAIIISAIFALVAVFLANSISYPIKKLTQEMEKVENSNFSTSFQSKNKDEIGKLGQSYVDMIKRLNNSTNQIYIEQEAKRNAEYKALEYQINPHFLYNTFSLLIWQIDSGDKEDAIETTKALSNIFAISISKNKSLITVDEEISHAKSYIEIQMRRFVGKFKIYYDIDENILNFYTPKIILQPILENAIQHGIIKNKPADGRIVLYCGKFEQGLEFIVKDNGNALSQSDAELLNIKLKNNSESEELGVGIKNVNNRIALKYGSNYGLKYYIENEYTCARITIPEIRKDNPNVQSTDSR